MREILCFVLSVVLMVTLVLAGSLPGEKALPAGRSTAWWGLLFPALFGLEDGEGPVIFDWPVIRWLFPGPRANG